MGSPRTRASLRLCRAVKAMVDRCVTLQGFQELAGLSESQARVWLRDMRQAGLVHLGPREVDEAGKHSILTYRFAPGGRDVRPKKASSRTEQMREWRARKKEKGAGLALQSVWSPVDQGPGDAQAGRPGSGIAPDPAV